MATVQFTYFTGIRRNIFNNVRLTLSNGSDTDEWTSFPMQQTIAEDDCLCFTATVELDDSRIGQQFRWGVILDAPAGNESWGIMSEVNDSNSTQRDRSFILQSSSVERP
jgi:1,4-alpha-glucan branching enzyme